MLTTGSRVPGRGSLLRSLRALIRRTERFATVRATPDQEQWLSAFYDGLSAIYRQALTPDAVASLRAVDERRRVSRKRPADLVELAERRGLHG